MDEIQKIEEALEQFNQFIAEKLKKIRKEFLANLKKREKKVGLDWLKDQPIGTRRKNSPSGIKFIVCSDGLHWPDSIARASKTACLIWYWDGSRNDGHNTSWHEAATWLDEACEETCPKWEPEENE